MVRVLIVEDSYVSRELLKYIFIKDGGIEVIGMVGRGEDAIALLESMKPDKPDVITMDIEMPGLDGYTTTRRIMETRPVPIVIISVGFQYPSAEKTFKAMQAGAVAAVGKPPAPTHPEFPAKTRELIGLVKAMAKVPVVRRYANIPKPQTALTLDTAAIKADKNYKLVVIGASTGGPPVLQTILSRLPKPFPLPIVIVQHIASGFASSLAEWLNNTCGLKVVLAEDNTIATPGVAYIAPHGSHTTISAGGVFNLQKPAENEILVPAVNPLFKSAAAALGSSCIGILLTGMGKDGAEGLLDLKNAGALTIIQDKITSIVYGMPREAEKLGAAQLILPPEEIASVLEEIGKKAAMGDK